MIKSIVLNLTREQAYDDRCKSKHCLFDIILMHNLNCVFSLYNCTKLAPNARDQVKIK